MERLIVYHTADFPLPEPDIRHGRKNADFGQGFYLTPEPEFAARWAREKKDADTYVNTYTLDLTGLEVLRLGRDAAWFDYIFQNRALQPDCYAAYDVIIGPIANDTIYNTFGFFTSGFLPSETSLRLLRLGPMYTQVAVKTDRAAAQLHWQAAEKLSASAIARARRKTAAEEEAYLLQITQALEQNPDGEHA